jgi:hypothetical protein
MTVPCAQSQALYQAVGSGEATFHTVVGAGHSGWFARAFAGAAGVAAG